MEMSERLIRSLDGGSKLYTFRFSDGSEEFEIVTTRDIAVGFVASDMTLDLLHVWDY